MIEFDCDQRSTEWYLLRAGIPTASSFKNIITGIGKKSTDAKRKTYMNTLLAEWLTGGAVESYVSQWMLRGIELEGEASEAYSFITDNEVRPIGFVLHGSKKYGASPDGLIDPEGQNETKVPAPSTHIGYLLDDRLPIDYIPQVQGQLLVTGRQWCDFISYCPGMDTLIIRVERDNDYIATLEGMLKEFVGELEVKKDFLRSKGYIPLAEAA